MKNVNEYHEFTPVNTVWTAGAVLVLIRCDKCKEQREIGCSLAQVKWATGCVRKGKDEPWQRGDLLVTSEGYLDEFVMMTPNSMALTWNAGGHWRERPAGMFKPAA